MKPPSLAILVGLVLLLLTPPLRADPGQLDRLFSVDGTATAFASGASGYAVAIDNNGRIVVAGSTLAGRPSVALARFKRAGRLDPKFGGGDGRVVLDLGGSAYGFDVAIRPDGRIVVAGERDTPDGSQMFVSRLGIHGGADATFGGGDGTRFVSFGRQFQGATAVALAGKGRVLLGGFTSNGETARWALARLLPDGSLDPSFDSDGKVTTALSNSTAQIQDLAVLRNGKVVAVGSADVGLIPRFALARYDPDGTLDQRFGTNGRVRTNVSAGPDVAYGLAVQPDGKLVLVGYADNGGGGDWGIARFGPRGKLDPTFGHGGVVLTAFTPSFEFAYGAVVQANGKLVVVGRAHRSRTDDDLTIVRYKPGGERDLRFGTAGKAFVDFKGGPDTGRAVLLQPNGKIVAAGEATVDGVRRIAVARVLAS